MALTRIQTDALKDAITSSNIADGTILPADINTSNDFTFNTVKVGKGNSAISTNTAVGASALAANTTGDRNTAVGYTALASNTIGWNNAAFGRLALNANLGGDSNTACGSVALYLNTSGASNAALGYAALAGNLTGSSNTAGGTSALFSNTSGSNNTAFGNQAMYSNQTAGSMVAIGAGALFTETSSGYAVAIGRDAYFTHNAAEYYGSVVIGFYAGRSATTGVENTFVGAYSARNHTTGNYNVAIGAASMLNSNSASQNTMAGYQSGTANVSGNYNAIFGFQAGKVLTQSHANTFIGNNSGAAFNGSAVNTFNTFVGCDSGSAITTGQANTIIGTYNGNQGGLDIRASNNYIVLSDGGGTPRYVTTNTGATYIGGHNIAVTGTMPTGGALLSVGHFCAANGSGATDGSGDARNNGYGFAAVGSPNAFGATIFPNYQGTWGADIYMAMRGSAGGTSTTRFQFTQAGALYNSTGTYGTISSNLALKQDIADMSSQWDDIKAIRFKKYRYISDVEKAIEDGLDPSTVPLQAGVIVEELLETSPGLVDRRENNDGSTTDAVKYSIMFIKATKALQEAMERIETLESKLKSAGIAGF